MPNDGTDQDIEHSGSNIAECTLLLVTLLLVGREREFLGVSGHDEGNRVRGVCRMGGTRLGVDHLLGVPMVGGDEQDVARLLARLVDDAHGLVGVRDGLNGGLVHTRVADHVWGCEVAHHKLVRVGLDDFRDLLCHSTDAHLRLLVVGCNLG